MAQERLVAVSYPADEEFTRINSEVLAGEAAIVYTYGLDDAQRAQTLRRAEAILALNLADEVPAGAFAESSRLRFVQMLSAGVDTVDFSALPDGVMVASNATSGSPESLVAVAAIVGANASEDTPDGVKLSLPVDGCLEWADLGSRLVPH